MHPPYAMLINAYSFTIRNLPQWYKHPLAIPTDSGLASYAVRSRLDVGPKVTDVLQELQRVLSRSLDVLYAGTNSVSGLQTDCDYLLVIKTIEAQFMAWQQEWYEKRCVHSSASRLLQTDSSASLPCEIFHPRVETLSHRLQWKIRTCRTVSP